MDSSAGAETSLHAVDPLLVQAGFEIHLAVLSEHQNLVPDLVSNGVEVHDLSGHSVLRQQVALAGLVRRLRPDLIHASLIQAALPSQVIGSLLRSRVLVTWASTPTDHASETVDRWKLQVVRWVEIASSATSRCRFHAVTRGVAATKARDLHVAPGRVRVAERGRDRHRFRSASEAERVVNREQLGIVGPDELLLLAVGRQEPAKDYPLLIRSFDEAAASRPFLRLMIAGRPGSATPEVDRAISSAWHADRIELLGQRDDVPVLLAAADAVVCTSRREGAAGSLIEAMAVGTPILSVQLDGLVGVLEDDVNALIVRRDEVAKGIGLMADDAALRQRLAESARGTFLDRFTVERSAAALADVYRWAARRR